jgi:hypothetical protein
VAGYRRTRAGNGAVVADTVEIDGVVTIIDTPDAPFAPRACRDAERSTWSLGTALHGHARSRNPSWTRYELLLLGINRPRAAEHALVAPVAEIRSFFLAASTIMPRTAAAA